MRLDIVIPAHNEEDRIDRTLRAYRKAVTDPSTRIVVALDRCTDGTADIVRSHVQQDERIELHEFPKLGKGGVIMESFRRCDGDLIGFVDADCATPPAEFVRLVEVAQATDADCAIASRSHPAAVLPVRRSLLRRVFSLVFARLTRVLFNLSVADTQCGAKVARREVIERSLPLLSSRDFLFDVDLLVTAERLGYRIIEVPTVWVDRSGSRVRPAADAGLMAMSSLRLWMHHRILPVRSVRPEPSSPSGTPPEVRRAG